MWDRMNFHMRQTNSLLKKRDKKQEMLNISDKKRIVEDYQQFSMFARTFKDHYNNHLDFDYILV